jgi:protein-S-isoprenylcysteine O-methyltransferase Ste14
MSDAPNGAHPLELRVPPPLVGLVLAALMLWLAPHGLALEMPPALRLGLALLLAAAGAGLDLAGLLAFRRQRTTVHPMRPEKTAVLVTSGVYRLTRNPMYLGLCLLLLGWAVWLDAVLAFLGPVAFVAWIHRFQIRPEERVLGGRFGAAFTDYTRQVRRWL